MTGYKKECNSKKVKMHSRFGKLNVSGEIFLGTLVRLKLP